MLIADVVSGRFGAGFDVTPIMHRRHCHRHLGGGGDGGVSEC